MYLHCNYFCHEIESTGYLLKRNSYNSNNRKKANAYHLVVFGDNFMKYFKLDLDYFPKVEYVYINWDNPVNTCCINSMYDNRAFSNALNKSFPKHLM